MLAKDCYFSAYMYIVNHIGEYYKVVEIDKHTILLNEFEPSHLRQLNEPSATMPANFKWFKQLYI